VATFNGVAGSALQELNPALSPSPIKGTHDRFRTKRQLSAYSGLAIERHGSVEYLQERDQKTGNKSERNR
jgi:hypothetical protein